MQQNAFLPHLNMTQKKIFLFFLILWTLYSGKEKVIAFFPLDLFKGTILYQSNYIQPDWKAVNILYPSLQLSPVLTWSQTSF